MFSASPSTLKSPADHDAAVIELIQSDLRQLRMRSSLLIVRNHDLINRLIFTITYESVGYLASVSCLSTRPYRPLNKVMIPESGLARSKRPRNLRFSRSKHSPPPPPSQNPLLRSITWSSIRTRFFNRFWWDAIQKSMTFAFSASVVSNGWSRIKSSVLKRERTLFPCSLNWWIGTLTASVFFRLQCCCCPLQLASEGRRCRAVCRCAFVF